MKPWLILVGSLWTVGIFYAWALARIAARADQHARQARINERIRSL